LGDFSGHVFLPAGPEQLIDPAAGMGIVPHEHRHKKHDKKISRKGTTSGSSFQKCGSDWKIFRSCGD